jgi:hypothetical protein
MDADCRGGSCILENSPATGATGFLGGYCVSFARRPPDSAYVEGSAIPQSNCPIGSAPFPSSDTTEGDGTTCFATCDGSHPCRPGYQCDHLEDTATHAPYFTNGFCLPLDCNRSGMACPSGYTCTTPPSDAAMPVGICVASGADGGTPDGGLADAASGG